MTGEHAYQIYIKADPAQVWRAITEAEFTAAYFYQTSIEILLEPGTEYRYRQPDGSVAVEGTVEAVEPGRRLELTWHTLYDPDLAAEPPGRVEWILTSANAGRSATRIDLRHFDLARSPGTWANVRHGWQAILDGMKTLLETGQPLGPVETPSIEPTDEVDRRWHRTLAVTANNGTWDLLAPTAGSDQADLAPDRAFELLGRAYAAAYHWRAVNGPYSINAARAAWLCSRCHAVCGDGQAAFRLAGLCQTITSGTSEASDFDRFYAREAEARALACLGRTDEMARAYAEAERLLADIVDPEDREMAAGDLAGGPWFGLRPA